jgi:hypothetical protein
VTSLYEADLAAWIDHQVHAMRQAGELRINLPIDFDYVAEELESMGRSHLGAYGSALVRIVEHLLKLEYSPASDPRAGWEESVAIHRINAARELDLSPSLKRRIDFEKVWDDARRLAAIGLKRDRIPASALPLECPYTLEQVEDPDFSGRSTGTASWIKAAPASGASSPQREAYRHH